MTTTYTWKIDMLHTLNQDSVTGAVTEIHWSKHGLHPGGIATRHPGMTRFDITAIKALKTAGGFTPLTQLTEVQVLTWIQNAMTQQEKDLIDLQLEKSYQHQITPVGSGSLSYNELPWGVS